MEIYCPKCEWEPPAGAEWTCECGHSWHTFDTHGQCPECGKVWRETQCHQCHEWSPHHDWYHDLPPVDVGAITEEQDAPADLAPYPFNVRRWNGHRYPPETPTPRRRAAP